MVFRLRQQGQAEPPTKVDGPFRIHRPSSGLHAVHRPMPRTSPHPDDDDMIHVNHLTKRYGDHLAVDDVSFRCEPGTVTGFLGPNGAGKSTTMRMLTGLTPPTSGSATIAGTRFADLPNPGRVVGVMLDASAQHPGRTGVETLRLGCRLLGLPTSAAEEMLDRVGLDGAGGRTVGNYSLGMRQRLGIANALLGDPAVLILDEPANGMDPEGIRWMRHLLQDFARRGGTVLLSSHLLAEVQATVDRLVVIGGGRVMADDRLDALLVGQGTTVRSLDQATLATALGRAGVTVSQTEDGSLRAEAPAETVGRVALAAGVVLVELGDGGTGLEDLYFTLTTPAAAA
jgi:ABC-2 type transport system ATP-binding protein